MRLIALAVLLAAGCASSNDWPAVEGMYRLQGGDVVCDGATVQAKPQDVPTEIICSWQRVQYQGAPHCNVMVIYQRADAAAPWGEPVVFASDASCGG